MRIISYAPTFHFEGEKPQFRMRDYKIALSVDFLTVWL
jgi:hypothetical protein